MHNDAWGASYFLFIFLFILLSAQFFCYILQILEGEELNFGVSKKDKINGVK
jgi:hypothetical protein